LDDRRRSLRILVVGFYYSPDLRPGAFRTTSLVEALRRAVPAGSHIDVVTTAPNRYHSFEAPAPLAEHHADLSIFRIPLRNHQSGMLDQAMAFLTFCRGAIGQTGNREYDIVFATSGRLMTAVLGAFIAARKHTPLYLDIRDIFVDNISYVLPRPISWFAKPVFAMLERWTVKRAIKVNLVSRGFLDYFRSRYPGQRFSFFTNGIDDEFLAVAPAVSSAPVKVRGRPITVVYAGNFGQGQGLHLIVPQLARRLESRVRFVLVGDGGRRRALEAALSESGATNVELRLPVKRDALVNIYAAADVLFFHLNDYDSFKTVLPSKVFEYAALGKPVWAGVAGYSADFVRSEIRNSAVFDPCDIDGAVLAFESLSIQETPRPEFVAKYSRVNISRELAHDILAAVSD
jgi:glycosyltransferase involved in cell wall biosynthesis